MVLCTSLMEKRMVLARKLLSEHGVIFISKVYVHKDMRKKGIASSLLKRLLNDYPDAKKWYLTVNKYNSNSIAAYKKCGFITTRELVTDIGNGFVMDDYVMEKLL